MGNKTNMIKKRMFCFTLLSVFLISSMVGFTGCGEKTVEQYESKTLKLYFANKDYIDTGNDKNGELVVSDQISISVPKGIPDGMTAEEAASYGYVEAYSMLWQVPDGLENAETVVTEKIGIHNITCKDGIAYVDLIGSGLVGKGGSLEETLFISQVVETLINSFDEIEKVQFLIDGETSETLMGHCDTSMPFTAGFF